MRYNELIQTPNGPGWVKDREEIDGEWWIHIAHKPGAMTSTEHGVRLSKRGIVWELWRYKYSELGG